MEVGVGRLGDAGGLAELGRGPAGLGTALALLRRLLVGDRAHEHARPWSRWVVAARSRRPRHLAHLVRLAQLHRELEGRLVDDLQPNPLVLRRVAGGRARGLATAHQVADAARLGAGQSSQGHLSTLAKSRNFHRSDIIQLLNFIS